MRVRCIKTVSSLGEQLLQRTHKVVTPRAGRQAMNGATQIAPIWESFTLCERSVAGQHCRFSVSQAFGFCLREHFLRRHHPGVALPPLIVMVTLAALCVLPWWLEPEVGAPHQHLALTLFSSIITFFYCKSMNGSVLLYGEWLLVSVWPDVRGRATHSGCRPAVGPSIAGRGSS